MLTAAIREKYTAVIGLEVHAQLLTKSKMYAAEAVAYGSAPNTNVSVITLAHPGTLPSLNKQAVAFALRMGLACGAEISRYNIFDRKNYYYPDLPKGYQITQDKTPICRGGQITIKTAEAERNILLNRIHLEEDSGKSLHLAGESDTLIDFNRAGTPLIEIVTEPQLRTAEEAFAFLTEIRRLVRYLEICDGNMEEGSLRCDVNVSLMPSGSSLYGRKVEVKNLNSFSNVKRAIAYEIERQAELLERGEGVASETRSFDAASGTTTAMRSKEDLNDYRYFPDPDLSPLVITEEWLQKVREEMPPLPWELYEHFISVYGLSAYDAQVLTESKDIALYYQEICEHTQNYKAAANWMLGPVKSYLNEYTQDMGSYPLRPAQLAGLIQLVDEGKLSFSMASQRLYPLLLQKPQLSPETVAEQENLLQVRNEESLLPLIREVLAEHPGKVAEYCTGRKALMGMFMGELMKKSKGKADPKLASQLLKQALEEKNNI